MKTLVIVSHPDMPNSRINKVWVEKAASYSNEITIHDLYREYPDFMVLLQSFNTEYKSPILIL